MFQAVIEQAGWSTGRMGTGVWVSLMVHAGVVGGALALAHQAADPLEKFVEVQVHAPRPPKGNPNPPAAVPRAEAPKPKPKPKEFRQPRKIPPPVVAQPPKPEVPEEPPEAPPTEPANDLPYIPGSDPNGVEKGGVLGAKVSDKLLGDMLTGTGTGEDVMPFGSGMTPPRLVSEGVALRYTADALRAQVQGLLIARCTISREGEVSGCRVIKGLPFMDEAVIEALTSRHYTPVTFQGRAVTVTYTFNVKLKLP